MKINYEELCEAWNQCNIKPIANILKNDDLLFIFCLRKYLDHTEEVDTWYEEMNEVYGDHINETII